MAQSHKEPISAFLQSLWDSGLRVSQSVRSPSDCLQLHEGNTELTVSLEWTYTEPGTYFPTALVESHRDGNAAATSRRIPNLDAARVVVKG